MKKIFTSFIIATLFITISSCKNAPNPEINTSPNLKKVVDKSPSPPKISRVQNEEASACNKKEHTVSNISFKDRIKAVKLGFYTREVTYNRGIASEKDLGKNIDSKRFTNVIDLDKQSTEKLFPILLNYTDGDLHAAHCYEPRHCIWFEDTEGKLLSYLEICFQCHQTRSSEGSIEIKCNKQFEELNLFVKNLDNR